ncbi:MAG: formate dehydrogenase accessory protein FdhE [Desulfobulbaceae bacterium]|nr:formate dehydrogenase accessory protein FdhE [Desulfobulbaceae bacterium]
MTSITTDIKELAAEIDRLATENPHASSLFQAFGPLLLGQHRWLQNRQDTISTFPVDPLKFQGGIPLCQQYQLLLADDPWQEAGLSVANAIGQGFPQFSEDMRRLSKEIKDETYDGFPLSDTVDDRDQRTVAAQKLGIEPVSLQLFQRYLTRLLLTKKAQDMAAELASLPWKKGYCPICGSFPHLAIIREKGQRWLQCATCSHQWSFSRLTCPHCDHEDPQETNYLFVEGEKEDTAFICGKCRKYLITSNQSGNLRQSHADLIAFSLAHLDLILQEKGFLPMAECEWNTFR